ncbi:GGDEF domain-containing protein [Kaistia geumhonensis]|uniref:diguanylate cyclase n=1 Tax=Kaistia geumhonensis TaxID=410839 RepID=A0ABU0M397_9HYPH|nr:GGDEF domain-containing protein [Kaistia geumhonensis]MCX5479336.1 GGDEF domain-containing protein [Kaistia geumhonensis]MDQ0515441.1 diguanylate cyclase (GGDEF)-like protein [Kaistia geumhonensis]
MSESAGDLSSLARRRKQIVMIVIAAGALVFLGLWAFETSAGLIKPSDQWAYPIVIIFLCVNLLGVAAKPWFQPYAELACYFGVAFYLVAQVVLFALGPPEESIYDVANTLQWMPALYVAAFMLLSRRRAVAAASVTFLLSALALGIAALDASEEGDLRVSALLVNAVVAHLLTLLLLSLVAMLRLEFDRVSRHARSMEDAARTDPLTGIANRRALEEWMQAFEDHDDHKSAALVLFDIDHFKSINDRHGHLVGDEILVTTAQLIRSQLRPIDRVGRWGGEEFLVILDNVTMTNALRFADRVRHLVTISAHPVAGSITISAGIALCSPGEAVAETFRSADAALYAAKSGGRNRVSDRA